MLCPDDAITAMAVRGMSVSQLKPLSVGMLNSDQLTALSGTLQDVNEFNTFVPFPSVAKSSPAYDPGILYQGASHLEDISSLSCGLYHYGLQAEARAMLESSMMGAEGLLLNGTGIYEAYNSDTGSPLGALNSSSSSAAILRAYNEVLLPTDSPALFATNEELKNQFETFEGIVNYKSAASGYVNQTVDHGFKGYPLLDQGMTFGMALPDASLPLGRPGFLGPMLFGDMKLSSLMKNVDSLELVETTTGTAALLAVESRTYKSYPGLITGTYVFTNIKADGHKRTVTIQQSARNAFDDISTSNVEANSLFIKTEVVSDSCANTATPETPAALSSCNDWSINYVSAIWNQTDMATSIDGALGSPSTDVLISDEPLFKEQIIDINAMPKNRQWRIDFEELRVPDTIDIYDPKNLFVRVKSYPGPPPSAEKIGQCSSVGTCYNGATDLAGKTKTVHYDEIVTTKTSAEMAVPHYNLISMYTSCPYCNAVQALVPVDATPSAEAAIFEAEFIKSETYWLTLLRATLKKIPVGHTSSLSQTQLNVLAVKALATIHQSVMRPALKDGANEVTYQVTSINSADSVVDTNATLASASAITPYDSSLGITLVESVGKFFVPSTDLERPFDAGLIYAISKRIRSDTTSRTPGFSIEGGVAMRPELMANIQRMVSVIEAEDAIANASAAQGALPVDRVSPVLAYWLPMGLEFQEFWSSRDYQGNGIPQWSAVLTLDGLTYDTTTKKNELDFSVVLPSDPATIGNGDNPELVADIDSNCTCVAELVAPAHKCDCSSTLLYSKLLDDNSYTSLNVPMLNKTIKTSGKLTAPEFISEGKLQAHADALYEGDLKRARADFTPRLFEVIEPDSGFNIGTFPNRGNSIGFGINEQSVDLTSLFWKESQALLLMDATYARLNPPVETKAVQDGVLTIVQKETVSVSMQTAMDECYCMFDVESGGFVDGSFDESANEDPTFVVTTDDPMTEAPEGQVTTSPADTSTGLAAGYIALIVICVILALLLLGFCCRKKTKKKERLEDPVSSISRGSPSSVVGRESPLKVSNSQNGFGGNNNNNDSSSSSSSSTISRHLSSKSSAKNVSSSPKMLPTPSSSSSHHERPARVSTSSSEYEYYYYDVKNHREIV